METLTVYTSTDEIFGDIVQGKLDKGNKVYLKSKNSIALVKIIWDTWEKEYAIQF